MIQGLSPLDDRYKKKIAPLLPIFSEFGLMKYRVITEISWLLWLSKNEVMPPIPEIHRIGLEALCEDFSDTEFESIKALEAKTNHDVKAVEYFLRTLIPQDFWSWIHFGCTSEDINNIAYALMLRDGRSLLLHHLESGVLENLKTKSIDWKSLPLLSRTHGQSATPTTLGKEIGVYHNRLDNLLQKLISIPIKAKMNGATGNFAAHKVAFPKIDWIDFSQQFITQQLDLTPNPLTTQIEPHDWQVEILNNLGHNASVCIDLCRDIWGYVSLGYFGQESVEGETGSSTMPHKVNPIDFENAEGNMKLSRGIAQTLSNELPISRWQRDLTDSTLQRNFGLVFGHFFLGILSLEKGLNKLKVQEENLNNDLEKTPEVLTEAIQTVLRAHGQHDAYEQLKSFSRGKALSIKDIHAFIEKTTLPEDIKSNLKKLKPQNYTGYSEEIVNRFIDL